MIQALANPQRFMAFSKWAAPIFGVIAVVSLGIGLTMAFSVPDDYQQKQTVRFMDRIRVLREGGKRVIIAGDVYGTGSSRKSATNSVMWTTGEDIPFIPNKRSGAVVLGSIIAPM